MIKVKKVKPMANYIVTTQNKYEEDITEGGLITKLEGSLMEFQKVIATGPLVRNIKEGDMVCINPRRYARMKHQEGSLKDGVITDNPVVSYNFNVIDIDDCQYLLLTDQDIDFVIEEWEEVPDNPSPIKIPKKKVLL